MKIGIKNSLPSLSPFVSSKRPAFRKPLHVGRPNVVNSFSIYFKMLKIFYSKILTNNGPYVHEFEELLCSIHGPCHVISVSNATIGLQLLIKALGLKGEVIVPSFTFIATPHVLEWEGVKPVFCDVDINTHLINIDSVRDLITSKTSAILGVHLWGQICNHDDLQNLCNEYNIPLIYDAAHAFGCRKENLPLGRIGKASVVSLHATKIINSLEGGFILTTDSSLAKQLKLMRNFGFTGYDQVNCLGINAKMNEISALVGLTNAKKWKQIVL